TMQTLGASLRSGACAVLVAGALAANAAAQVVTTLVSKAPDGSSPNCSSSAGIVSPNGRFVTFNSCATNLGPPDLNGHTMDGYVWDRLLGQMDLVTLSSNGTQINQGAGCAFISSDGRFLLIGSNGQLSPEDTNNSSDVYVRDRVLETTVLVSQTPKGVVTTDYAVYAGGLSDDGRFVLLSTSSEQFGGRDTENDHDAYWRDRVTGVVKRVSVSSHGMAGNGESYPWSTAGSMLSSDGRKVFFRSSATNLVRGDTNGMPDMFGHDVLLGRTTRLSVNSAGFQTIGGSNDMPAVSPDGRFLAWSSSATNLDPVHDQNGFWDIYWRDNLTGQVLLCSRTPSGMAGNDQSGTPAVSANGRYVAFQSRATDLVASDANGTLDIFRFDTVTGEVLLVSQSSNGAQGNHPSIEPSISGDGSLVTYVSYATNLVPNDDNDTYDVFLTELPIGP
ncbi:MAG: PD40 domain-containing protein, partial [Planctomycetes bacterium]|nr:PD40 domain-containing protein [Planctomycetota bacterium]